MVGLEPIETSSLKDQAYARIKSLILSGGFCEREPLPIDQLSVQLEISRTPVREALLTLEGEHLVTSIPYKGTYVAELSAKEVQEIYQVREPLEAMAARLASPLIPDDELAELRALFRGLAQGGLSDGHFESDTRLHGLILDHCGNAVLKELLMGLSDRIHRVRRFSARQGSSHLKLSFREHRLLLDALMHRNAAEAERLMAEHIRKAGKRIVGLVQD